MYQYLQVHKSDLLTGKNLKIIFVNFVVILVQHFCKLEQTFLRYKNVNMCKTSLIIKAQSFIMEDLNLSYNPNSKLHHDFKLHPEFELYPEF
jgi:hypothetical protein